MKALHNFECRKGHQFEQYVEWDQDTTKCPQCRSVAERVWLAPRSPHRQLKDPIVFWKYADGTVGVAGGSDSRTPSNAERVEVRTIGEYRQHVKQLNQQWREKEERRDERYFEAKEKLDRETRSRISYLMGQESDPVARDIYRVALEANTGGSMPSAFSEIYAQIAEMDASNREGGRGQRK